MSNHDNLIEKYMIKQLEANYDDLVSSLESITTKGDIPIVADKLYKNYVHYLDVLLSLDQRTFYFDKTDKRKYKELLEFVNSARAYILDSYRDGLLADLGSKLRKFIEVYSTRPTVKNSELSHIRQPKKDDWWDRARREVIGDYDLTDEEKRAIDERLLFGEGVDSESEDIYEKIDKELLLAIKRLNDQARQGFYRPLAHQIRENEKAELSKGTDKPLSALEKASILALKVEEGKYVD